jgi:hypothetical protein
MFLLRSLPERVRLRRAPRPREARVGSEHRRRGRLMEWLLSFEIDALGRGRRIPFGASCIVVATKRAAMPG